MPSTFQAAFRRANDPDTTADTLAILADSDNDVILGSVALNTSTPPAVLQRLAAMGNKEVDYALSCRPHHPVIRSAETLTGNQLVLRDVVVDDAAFILGLRLDPKKSAYLSAVPDDVQAQAAWIERYQAGTGQAYFIICGKAGEKLGTVRLYSAIGNSFSWGSWIVTDAAPANTAIESALMVYRYALDTLGFTSAHFEVDRKNTSVWTFHERFGAVRVKESATEYFYEIGLEPIRASMARYRRFLPGLVAA